LSTPIAPTATKDAKYLRPSPKASAVSLASSGPAKAAITPPERTSVTANGLRDGVHTSIAAKR
jgi:hypothetical protein